MKNPKDISTFLNGFNLGAILTMISMLDVLLKSQNKLEFFVVLFMISINGVVIGIVTQYVLIHSNITRNMVYTFLKSKDKIPTKLLNMRNGHIEKTLKMMAGIRFNIKKNLIILFGLLLLLMLSLCLPILYSYQQASRFVYFGIFWSVLVLLRTMLRSTILINNSRYLVYKMDILFAFYEFEPTVAMYKHVNDDSET
ncbi:MAG TPA: hypothetical protein DCY20_00425 [Firmicutes bacterium]|nr:hypothetical protein [Bacillota bacterium]